MMNIEQAGVVLMSHALASVGGDILALPDGTKMAIETVMQNQAFSTSPVVDKVRQDEITQLDRIEGVLKAQTIIMTLTSEFLAKRLVAPCETERPGTQPAEFANLHRDINAVHSNTEGIIKILNTMSHALARDGVLDKSRSVTTTAESQIQDENELSNKILAIFVNDVKQNGLLIRSIRAAL